MTNLADLLQQLHSLDIRLTLEGDRLNVSAPKGALTEQLREQLSRRKEEIKSFLREARAGDKDEGGIQRIPRDGELPVSHMQKRLWFLKQMDPSSSVYNVSTCLSMKGRLDVSALERAFRDLILRHESLRTRFVSVDGEPRCVIETNPTFFLERHDTSHLAEPEAEARRLLAKAAGQPFSLDRAPLMRATLVRVAPDLHYFCFVFDHIVVDGLSVSIFVIELQAYYTQYVTGKPANLPPLPVQYVDYAHWEERWLASGAMREQLAYWKHQLAPITSALQLPTDRPRPSIQTFNGARRSVVYPAELARQLKSLARAEGVTLYMVLLGAFQVLLHRYTGAEYIPVGSAVANRHRPEIDRVMGFFANNLVLLGDLRGNPTVRELIARVRDTALRGYANQNMPFDVLVDELVPHRQLDQSPLFQVLFVLHTLLMDSFEFAGLTCKPVDIEISTSRFELCLDVFDVQQGLCVYYEYNTDLFDEATILRMSDHYRQILEEFVRDPTQRVRSIRMLNADEERRLLYEFNDTRTDFPRELTLHGLFERQAQRTSTAVAVRFENAVCSYADLDGWANRIAHALRDIGVVPGSLVGVCVDRSIDMVAALLGVLKSGAAYVPLDPGFPKDRLEFMARDASLQAVVTQAHLEKLFAAELRKLCLDTDSKLIDSQPASHPSVEVTPDMVAYVIYTSGSTGRPKGVQVEHRNVVNFLCSMHREPGITASDRLLSVTTLSFDIAALEIFGPLTVGGTVVIADRATALDGQRLMQLLDDCDATIMQATPATWRLLFESGWGGKSNLKMLCGGEPLPRDLADRLLAAGGELWNMYGPTETTIWSTVARVSAEDRAPHIGRPIANTQVYVLDEERKPTAIGIPGELYIGGEGVARGYLGRPELTAERFVTDLFAETPNARMYRTGDLARWRADGVLECLGRADEQVKVRGYRIEPGEIEVALAAHPGIAQAAVVARPDSSGTLRLVAYLVSKGEATDPSVLRRFLAATLPDYMIPSVFVYVPQLPLTPNGKIDRKALPTPSTQALATSTQFAEPANDLEATIAAIWQEVLKVERVGRNDNFFDLGGHSLLIVQVQSRIQKRLGRNVPLVELFQHPTVAALAGFFETGGSVARLEAARERASRQRALRVGGEVKDEAGVRQ